MAEFLLIHGAHHTGACFHPVAERLRTAGHRVRAPDLPPNDEVHIAPRDVDLAVYAEYVADQLRAIGEPAVLLGHSLAGPIISAAAELEPGRVRDLVYLTALMIPPGESIHSFRKRFFGPDAPASDTARYRTLHEDGKVATMDLDGAREMMYQRCTEPQGRAAVSVLRPQPLRIYDDVLELTDDRWGRVRRTYVLALDDRTLPPPLSAFMLEEVGADRVEVIDTDHSPFLSASGRLARLLETVAALPEPAPR